MKGVYYFLLLLAGICLAGSLTAQQKRYVGGYAAGYSLAPVNFGVTVSAPSVLCEHAPATFTATLIASGIGSYSYEWWKTGGSAPCAIASEFNIAAVRLSDAGDYYCRVTDQNGVLVVSETLTLKVNPIAIATITAPSARTTTICYGQELTLTGSSSVSGATFSWRGMEVTGALNGGDLQVKPTVDRDYILKTDNFGCFSEDTITVKVNNPQVDIPYMKNASEGSVLQITACDGSGNPIAPATGLTWTTKPATSSSSGVNPFSLTASTSLEAIYVSYNNAGCPVYDTTLINTKGGGAFRGGVNDGFSRTSVNFGLKLDMPEVLCEKDSSTFKTILFSAGMETYTYAWKKVGESGVKSTADSYKIVSAALSDAGKYYCELKDPTGITAYSDTVTLKVNVLAIPTITTSGVPPVALGRVMTICYGDTLRLAGTCNVSDAAYTWRGAQIAGVSNTKTLKALPLSTGDYILKTDNAGCFREDTVTVLINRPVADIPYVLNATDGSLLEITALDINGVALAPATGLKWTTRPATTEKKDINPYSLTATADLEMIYVSYDRAGCVVEDSTLINSKGGGSFRGGINDGFARTSLNFGVSTVIPEVLCQHTDTAFHASVVCAEDPAGYRVEWFKVGTPDVSKSTDWRFPLPDAALSDAGDYFCKVSNVEGLFVYSDTVTLKVNEVAIARIVQPVRRDTMICYGDTLSLFGGTSVADAAISWRGTGIVGDVNAALTEVAPLTDADYILKTDNQGCATEDTITVRVNKPFVDIPTIINTTEGSTLLLTAVDAAQQALPPAGLEWKQKPATFINANCNPLIVPDIKKDMTIEVTRVSDGCPVVDSTKIVVKNIGAFRGGVNDGFAETCLPPVILVQPTAGDRQCVSTTQTLDLKVVAEGTSIVYRWEKYNNNRFEFEPFTPAHSGITGVNSATLSFQNMTDQDNGQYRCVLSNACSGGDIITDTCRVSVKGEPVIISGINVDQDQCAGSGPFEFNVIAKNSAGTGNLKYRWYKDGRQISAEADTSKNYYKFTIGPNTSAEGLYVVEVSNNCGSVYDTAFLPVILPPSIVDQSVDIYACEGGLAEFWVKTNRDEKYRYELYKLTEYSDLSPKELVKSSYTNKITISGVTVGGFYQFRVYHERCGSIFSTPMTLHIEKPVVIKQQPRDTTLCAGGTVTLKVKAETEGNTPINYQWYKDGVMYGSRTAVPVLTIPNIAYERDTVRYECVASNTCKSVRTKVAKVVVKRAPVISHGPISLPEYCEGDTLNMEVELATPMADIDSVRWFYQGKRLFDVPGKVSGSTTLALEIDSLTSHYGGGYYYMEVYNQCSSAVSRQTSFKLLEPARFLRDLSAGVNLVMCSGDEQELIVQATGSPSIRYIWTQNDVVIADGYSNRLNVSGVQLDKRDKFTCHIQNTCGDELTTAYIVLSKAKEFAFEGGGHFCERDAVGTTACLRGSDTSVLYQLYRRPNVLVSEIHGRDVVPAFGDICFQKLATAGEYFVTGVDTNRCKTTMPGVATVIQDPIPVDYNFYITRHLCQDGSDADLELAGSEVGVDYYLCKMKLGGGWDTVPTPWAGNGARIRFILSEGTYKIVAKRQDSGCSRDLSSIVNVMRRPLPDACPLRFVNNDSIYCSNSRSDIKLQYGCFEAGSSYQLKQNNTNYSSAKTAVPVLWNGLEEGTYSIQVTNSWGCTATFGHSVVKKQAPPARHTLIGRNYYCKDEVGNSWVELTSSDAGIRYSFRYHTNQIFKDTLSKGGSILLQVPLSDRDYYVMATDTTPEHCTVAMYDTIVLRQSRLSVIPTSPVVVGYQDQTTLNIAVSGVVGTASYQWTPANLLEVGQTTVQNPKTEILTRSVIYHVVVKDNSACPVEADVVVNVMGGDLAGEIRDKSGVNPVDTVRLCKGDPIELSAVISGGYCGGAYVYKWKDEKGPLAGSALLTPYKKEEDGHIYLEVACGKETVRDTVTVLVNYTPAIDTILQPGLRCPAAGDPVTISLKRSDPNTFYYLDYSTDRNVWLELKQGNGNGGVLDFVVPNATSYAGYFRVRARLPHIHADGGYCEKLMYGEVEIREGAPAFTVTGDTAYCADAASVMTDVRLSGQAAGVTYTLYHVSGSVAGVFAGPEPDGMLHFRQTLTDGKYIVKGGLGNCILESPDTVDVIKNPLPGMGTLTGEGQYCNSQCPVEIGITQGEPNVTYTFTYRPVVGTPVETDYTGVGKITFGTLYCDLGSYSLKAENTLTGCRISYKDSVIIAETPGVFNVAGDTVFCENSLSVTADLRLTGGVTGVTYTLYRLPNVSAGIGAFTGPEPDGLFHFRQSLTEGRYIVKGKVGNCERESLDTIDVVRRSLPAGSLPTLIQPYDGCENPGLLMGLSTSSNGTIYTLYRDNLPIATLNGVDGTSLSFGTYTIPGTYHVKATLQAWGCTNRLLSEYNIEKIPGQVAMTGNTTYCEDVAGVTLGLNGTENNVRYKLQRYNILTLLYEDVAGGVITGNGSAMNFTGIYPEATYRVVAGMWCETVMGVPMVVKKVKFPVVSLKLQREGNACTDSTVVLYLSSAPATYDYQLYKNGVKVGAAQSGSGSRLDWTLSPAAEGIYYVRTEVDGCAVTIPDSTEIGRFPALVPLKGDTIYCQGSSATLYLPTYNSAVTYKLYDLPGDTVVKVGTPSGARLEFKPLKKGNYYVRAFRGDCEDRGLPVSVDSVKSPVIPAMEVADCVDQDSGWIKLKGLVAGNRYVLSGRMIERYTGDSTFRKLATGIYALQVTDTLYGCRSAIVTDTIREGVYNDSLIPPFAYCAGEQGVRLKLSGVRRGVKYSILTTGGTVIETVRYPSLQFSRFYSDGHYIFRRERESFPAGCLEETLFKVDKFELPKQDLAVTLIGANPACEGSDYEVEVAGTENGIRYILQRISPAANIDTLFGNGGMKRFARKFSAAGEYRVVASDTVMYCAASLTQTVKVFALPSVSVTDGEYCYTAGSVPPAEGASIRLSGMEQNVLYRLDMLDTLYGPGTALFKKQLAGTYNVVAEDLSTGCTASYPAVINTKPGPNQYTMTSGCYPSSDVIDINTNGSDAGVNYYLYRDGVKTFPAVTRPGTGAVLSFGDQDIPGVYKIWAESANSCGLFLRDSVVVYQALKSCDLTIVGSFCSGETTKGVELRMACSVLGWKYYITNGFYTGDTLAGNGGILAWSKLDHNQIPIRNGVYDLRALNACGGDVLISTVTVGSGLSPTPWPLKNKPSWYCAPEKFSLELVGSDLGVKYTVKRYSTSGVLVQTYPAVNGTGNPLVLGTSFAAAGIYEVVADNGCPSQIAMWEVKSGVLPVQYPIVGTDVCQQTIEDSVRISIPVRQNGISYYLYKDILPDGLKVDSLTLAYRPAPELNFKAQGDIGCYYVVGANGSSGCRREMTGRLCLNTSPNLYHVEPVLALGDTLRTCRGADTSIWLSGSEAGIGYELLQNGARIHTVTGTGSRIKVGPVTESGIYKVRAYVCGVMMQDSVIVKVNELPMLSVDEELRYCENTIDTIKVRAFTSDQRKYTLYRPDGSWVEERGGRSDGAGFAFVTPVDVEGFYYIEAKETATGCIRRDSTKVTMERQPVSYDLTSTNGEYICRGSSVYIGLTGSEAGVRYELHRFSPAEKLTEKVGTGTALRFDSQVKMAGTYYVRGIHQSGLGCTVDFGSLTLKQADTLYPYQLESLVNSYCITSATPMGSVLLGGSQIGKEYFLLKDGVLMENSRKIGTGGTLTWTGLEGKACDDNALVDGYVYRAVVRDPVSGCERNMYGADTIVAASPLKLLAQEPKTTDFEKCEGSEVKFSVTVSGCRANYLWTRYGTMLKSGKEPFYNIDVVRPQDYGVYQCIVTNSCGTLTVPATNLKVRELVVLAEPMPDERICNENTKSVMFSAGFKYAETYAWYKLPDEVTVLGTRDYYELKDLKPSDAGKYVCVAGNRCIQNIRDTVELFFGGAPEIEIDAPRTDTLCFGSDYKSLTVKSNAPLLWYLNGVATGVTGDFYQKNSVTRADEGSYSVRATNACGTTTLPVGQLYVDDTLKVFKVTDENIIRCPNDGAEQLFIDVRPHERVSYTWTDVNNHVLGTGNTLNVGPFALNTSTYYRVWYMNKCSSGTDNSRSIGIRVPDTIHFTDPLRDLVLCADCATDTVLRLKVPGTIMAGYEWYYREKKDDVNRKILSYADTIAITACTRNTGYYYCRVFNRCETKTTQTTWIRVDSIPVINTSLPDDTICEGGWIGIKLAATGGGLTYRWNVLKKDGTLKLYDNHRADFVSEDELVLSNVDITFDSCQIWCQVFNTCGITQSDTMILRVDKRRELKVNPTSLTICGGGSAEVELTMENGVLPWKYRYTIDGNDEQEVTEGVWMKDTLTVIKQGFYQVTYFEDALGCIRTTGLPSFDVTERPKPTATISGGGEVCMGSSVSVQVSVTGGVGSWKVYIYRLSDGLPADDLPVSCPMILPIGKRDSTFKLTAVTDETYYVQKVEDLYNGQALCEGLTDAGRAIVKVNQKLGVRFTPLSDNHVGMCNPIDLLDKLKPFIANSDGTKTFLGESDGTFYVDTKALPNKWWVKNDLKKGQHTIKYVYAADGCSLSPEVDLVVDTLPSGVTDLDEYICRGGGNTDMTLTLSGAAPFKIDVLKNWIQYGGTLGASSNRISVPVTGNSYVENPVSLLPTDSCVFYTISNITDKHGCKSDQILKDTLTQANKSEFDVEVRYPNRDGVAWQPALLSYNIPTGDSLGVRFTQTVGNGYPWHVIIADNNNLGGPLLADLTVHRRDTVISLKDAYTYLFRPVNDICGQNPWDDQILILNHMDTGYIRAKVLLEGAYTNSVPQQKSTLEPYLPLYGMAALPANCVGHVVDWIEVEVRSNVGGLHPADSAALLDPGVAVLCRDTCLLLDNGTIVDRTGNDTIALPHCCVSGSTANDCFVVLRHRNHLAVMTADAWRIVDRNNRMNVKTIDFTKAANIYLRSGSLDKHMKEVKTGVWSMVAGEVNSNSMSYARGANNVISTRDSNIDNLKLQSTPGYYLYDVNFDGVVDWPGWRTNPSVNSTLIDWLLVNANRNRFTEINFSDVP